MRMTIMKAFCTFVISVVIRVTRPGIEQKMCLYRSDAQRRQGTVCTLFHLDTDPAIVPQQLAPVYLRHTFTFFQFVWTVTICHLLFIA